MDQALPDRKPDRQAATPPEQDDDSEKARAAAAFALLAPHVDAAFYLGRNPDVAAARADPAEHYWQMGWREGRDPNPWFQTGYYLRTNPDVRNSGVNPLWHFIAQGRQEGRQSRPAGGGGWHMELGRAEPYSKRPPTWTVPPDAVVLETDALRTILSAACEAARGLVVSISHDRYPEVPGGTQLLVADEQRKFNGDCAAYLHLSPVEARHGLAPASPALQWLNVILDGERRGIATTGAVTLALDVVPDALPRILVLHALHGHRPEVIAAMAQVLKPIEAFFWIHDYGSACASPQLLRNDIAFCHAPLPESLACRICVHGEDRGRHLSRVRALFDAVPFHVVAPSPTALTQWQRAVALPARSLIVHPHATLEPQPTAADIMPDNSPVRVAFVGQAVHAKGWGTFSELLATANPDIYQFFHFATARELAVLPGVIAIAAETSALQPFGMVTALAEHRIDLVLALSPWPETFGYVAHEALAAGADLVALAGTGNIAALVRQQSRGVVLDDGAGLSAYFTSGQAAEHARLRRASGQQRTALVHCGSTASISVDGAGNPVTNDPDLHIVVDGRRLDGVRIRDTWHFALPDDGGSHDDPLRRTIRLRSRHMRPSWESAAGADARRLGVAVTSLILDGAAVPSDDPRRVRGWHTAEPGWQWTDGDAALATGGGAVLQVTLVLLARYWRSPVFGAAHAA